MKKNFAYCAMLCALLSMMMQSTLAYFTAEETAQNVITSGGIEIQVMERQQTDNGLKPYPLDAIQIMPGGEISKIVSVQNMGESAWVRMAYTVTVMDAEGVERSISDAELKKVVNINIDTVNWSCKDGWWYYNHPLAEDEESKPLFTEVIFSGPEMGNAYQNNTIMIDVVAQAVQQAHNGENVMDAAGWPMD